MLAFEITVPAVRGLQAGHEYYVSAVPLRYIPRVFPSCGNDSTSKVSGQPAIDKKRVRELAQYMLDNPAQYALPPIIACIDGRVDFVPVADGANANIGCVRVPMDARISVSDGAPLDCRHRNGADRESRLGQRNGVGRLHTGRCIQTLPTTFCRSCSLLGPHFCFPRFVCTIRGVSRRRWRRRSWRAVPWFAELTETEKSSISNRSTKLFTLSAIHGAVQVLLVGLELRSPEEKTKVAAEFWIEVGQRIPAWQLAKEHKVATANLRREYIHCACARFSSHRACGESTPCRWSA